MLFIHIVEGILLVMLKNLILQFALKRLKQFQRKKGITGPANLEIANIPTLFLFHLGFFRINKNKARIIFLHMESVNKDFFRNGGYYFAINDYFDLSLISDIYTKG